MNLFQYELPLEDERFDTLFEKGDVQIVRIVSAHVKTPKTFCDKKDEWVVLLKGRALLELDGIIELQAGESLYIPANKEHRLLEVEPGTLWLAFHFKS